MLGKYCSTEVHPYKAQLLLFWKMEAYLALQALQSIVSYLIMVPIPSFLVWGVEGQASF